MKKIIFIMIILLLMTGCSSAEKKEGKILKNQDFDGAVKIRFEGRAERVFLNGDVVNLGCQYYLVPGEYLVSWNPRSFISIGVSVGVTGKGNTNNNLMEQRSNAKIDIEKNSVVELKGNSAVIIEAEGNYKK